MGETADSAGPTLYLDTFRPGVLLDGPAGLDGSAETKRL